MKKADYPDKYQGFKLKWIENKPFKKKGDQVIILKNEKYEIITLDKMTKEPMQLKWIRMGCRSCKRPGSAIEVGKYVYRWNDGIFTEHPNASIDPVRELNILKSRINYLEKDQEELSHKATLYDQIKMSINGEIFENDY